MLAQRVLFATLANRTVVNDLYITATNNFTVTVITNKNCFSSMLYPIIAKDFHPCLFSFDQILEKLVLTNSFVSLKYFNKCNNSIDLQQKI